MIVINDQALNSEIRRFNAQVARYVDNANMEAAFVVKQQAEFLMKEITGMVGPKNKSRIKAKIARDAKGVFVDRKRVYFPKSKQGDGSMLWYQAVKKDNGKFLAGIKRVNYRVNATPDSMQSMYKARAGKMGKMYRSLGVRGGQEVRELNRIMVSVGALRGFIAKQSAKVGKLKASFAVGWAEVSSGKFKPAQWFAKHIPGVKSEGSTFINGLGHKTVPTFTIISRAAGVGHRSVKEAVKLAMQIRISKIKSDFANGYIFKRLEKQRLANGGTV